MYICTQTLKQKRIKRKEKTFGGLREKVLFEPQREKEEKLCILWAP